MSLHQDDIDAVLYFLTEELNVDVVFDNDEPNAYWNSDRGIVSISTKQSKRLQLYTVLHEA